MPGTIPRTTFARRRGSAQFDKVCTIRRVDDEGDPVVVHGPGYPCSLVSATDENQRVDDDVVGVGGWIVIVSGDADVQSADRIDIGDQTYMVVRVLGPQSHMANLRALCTET